MAILVPTCDRHEAAGLNESDFMLLEFARPA
jgi:hypothetical protein